MKLARNGSALNSAENVKDISWLKYQSQWHSKLMAALICQ